MAKSRRGDCRYFDTFKTIGYARYNQAQHSLSAYVFSDRGLYRPGDTAHIGMIVKQAFANAQPPGLIVEATVTDPRGTTLLDEKFTLDETGYLSLDFTSEVTSLTGQYWVSLYLVKDQRADSLLGSTNIHVAEFQPDRMRIKTDFSSETPAGWLLPTDLKANVQLWNLYGAPAIGHRVAGKLLLEPKRVEFSQFPDYIFADPLRDPKKPAKVFTDTLQDSKTNEQGDAEFQLNLERFDKATYQLTFFAEGFEAEGGRSVTTQISALISPLPYFVGYKADGDLRYIKQNSQRAVHFIAVNPQLKQQALADLTLQFVSLQPVSTLVKNPNGTYQYQSIIKNRVLSAKAFSLGTGETPVVLPTEEIGDFMVQVFDKNHIELSHFQYSVVGTSQKSMANNAELQVKLDRLEYNAHDEIELQITSPYTGAGLITIERDKVYAIQWFKSETTNSVQKIRIPNDFEGNGYVNVMFVRDWNSPDIFISPLSYSVAPFTVSPASHDLQITLNIPSLVKPGGKLNLEYRSDKPGKIIVFAADEGILQVANYHTPAPLDFFFQKRALDVSTQQTVDQILPQYIRARELSAVGGDGGEVFLSKYLNPFRRKTDRPVAFWSGIVDSDTTPRQLTYDIPDYFNGTLNVMAVAVAANSVGSAEKKLTVRGDFIISPNTPTFVAPGDEFEVSASIANNLEQARDANVNVELKVTPNLEIRGVREESIAIAKGHEQTVHFTLRATKALGEAKITWIARFKDQTSTLDATLSVRPASLFFTTLHSGQRDEKKTTLRVDRTLYSEYRQLDALMSQSPLILVAGLQRYLDNFPYGCTEQLTSKAFPLLAMHHESWFAQDASTINQKIQTTIQLLRARQMSNGGISYWPGFANNASNAFASIYAMHFLTEAKSQGFEVPAELLQGGLSYLRDVASQNPSNVDMARQQAYAIYVLTRNEIVTTNYLTNLQLYLDKDYAKTWQQELV